MTNPSEYVPPGSAAMRSRQNEPDALRLLLAQRKLYSKAKRWLGFRWLGMLLLALGAPVMSTIRPSTAVITGAVAGTWLFLGRTWIMLAQSLLTVQAASVQEQFDFLVFGMPNSAIRSTLPSRETIAVLSGPDNKLESEAAAEKLVDWYPFNEADDGTLAIAIAQRANVSYTDSLLRSTAVFWALITSLWIIALIVASVLFELKLSAFLLGIVLPVLPAFLDLVQYVIGVWRSASDRADLTRAIEARIHGNPSPPAPDDLLVWQQRVFDLRRSTPQVPDFIYCLRRTVNEGAMHTAAGQLSQLGRQSGDEAD